MLELTTGLIVGILFGFLLKKARFCPTGIIRDIYLEKRKSNIFILLSVIFTQSLIYFALVKMNIISELNYDDFSLLAVAIGSFIFGFGAVIANGCMTSSLIKFGDGRIVGIISVLTFMITGYICTNGFLANLTERIGEISLVEDNLNSKFPFSPLYICIPILILIYFYLYNNYKKFKPKYTLPRRSSGLRYIFFEKIWSLEFTSILIGILMGAAYLVSEHSCSRTGGIAISSPLMSWVYALTSSEPLVSGG